MRSRKPFPLGFLSTLFCLVAVALAACGGGDRSGGSGNTHAKAPDSQQVFVQPLPGADIVSFDPALSPDLFSSQAIEAVFTGLVGFDDKLNITPELAQSWDETSDGLTWTFHLRANLKFSDGTPLTSTDVAYSIDRSLQPAVKSTLSLAYEGLILDSDKDGDTIYNAYQVGQIDTTGTAGVPSAQVAQARTRTKEYTTKLHLSIAYIAFNYLTKPFDNIHIRQAFALALNKDVLASDV